jgi:hypothetical protein
MTGDGTTTVRGWRNHIQGATRLIELRGSEQLHTAQGLDMFTDLRTQIVRRHPILFIVSLINNLGS